MRDRITGGLKASAELKLAMLEQGMAAAIADVAETCIAALRGGGKILLAGNGGSAADAQHIAAELVGRYLKDRPALAAIALTTDTSSLTAIANDSGYRHVFSRQLEALARPGDVFWAMSTSGDSENLIEALGVAGRLGLTRVCLLGRGGGAMKTLADIGVVIPSGETPRIQEAHITVAHLVCEAIESAMESER